MVSSLRAKASRNPRIADTAPARRIEAFAPDLTPRIGPVDRFAAKATVFCEGDPADDLFEIVEGVLKLDKLLPDGRRQVTGFLFHGDLLGHALLDRYVCTAETVSPAKLYRYGRAELNKLFEHLHDYEPPLGITTGELRAAQDRMLLLDRKGAMARLASFLLRIVERTATANGNGTNGVDLTVRRVDIANYLELSSATVERVLRRLHEDKVIKEVDRVRIAVLRPDELRRRAMGACHNSPESARYYPRNRARWPS